MGGVGVLYGDGCVSVGVGCMERGLSVCMESGEECVVVGGCGYKQRVHVQAWLAVHALRGVAGEGSGCMELV